MARKAYRFSPKWDCETVPLGHHFLKWDRSSSATITSNNLRKICQRYQTFFRHCNFSLFSQESGGPSLLRPAFTQCWLLSPAPPPRPHGRRHTASRLQSELATVEEPSRSQDSLTDSIGWCSSAIMELRGHQAARIWSWKEERLKPWAPTPPAHSPWPPHQPHANPEQGNFVQSLKKIHASRVGPWIEGYSQISDFQLYSVKNTLPKKALYDQAPRPLPAGVQCSLHAVIICGYKEIRC